MVNLAPTVGILTLYVGTARRLEERRFLAGCVAEGVKLGLDVFVFTPEDVARGGGLLRAHVYDVRNHRWRRMWRRMPDVVYDRCRYQTGRRFSGMRQFRQRYPHLLYLNHPLANKWRVHEWLQRDKALEPYLPETALVRTIADLRKMSDKHRVLYLKPVNGTGGRGILRLSAVGGGMYVLEGRDRQRRILTRRSGPATVMITKALRFCRADRYLVQQAIDVRLKNGTVHDYRLIVQKDGNGKWTFTGGGARIGRRGSITSNLHGGGQALSVRTMLGKQFSSTQIARILADLKNLCGRVAEQLERRYGRLCELALDVAIDRLGHPWLLEVNPKPAREIFAKTGQKTTYRTAIRRPLEFARWLYGQKH